MVPSFYLYKITFVDGYYYYGLRKIRKKSPQEDGYYGSPVTHKEKWETTMFYKEVLETYETFEEVREAEINLIRPCLNDPLCLNENCGGGLSLTAIRKGHERQREMGVGLWSPDFINPSTPEIQSAAGKVGGKLPWWNNGEKNTRSEVCPGEGWVLGRLVKWRWWNDGERNIRASECPEGFVPGRLMKTDHKGRFAT